MQASNWFAYMTKYQLLYKLVSLLQSFWRLNPKTESNIMQDFKENLFDFLTAIGIGLLLAIGALAYFDVLVKWG